MDQQNGSYTRNLKFSLIEIQKKSVYYWIGSNFKQSYSFPHWLLKVTYLVYRGNQINKELVACLENTNECNKVWALDNIKNKNSEITIGNFKVLWFILISSFRYCSILTINLKVKLHVVTVINDKKKGNKKIPYTKNWILNYFNEVNDPSLWFDFFFAY